ncbi:MAG TPA: TlpA disulfide reductase family protein [Candidatus Tumulicola sp.]|nr:TlpA disulfide reductase family protein [Candidatus Tumulicola sp.]
MGNARAALAAALIVALPACSGSAGKKGASPGDTTAHVGKPAPAWAEPAAPGGTISMQSLRGKVVYLNFFATWCPPCNEEASQIEALQRRFGADGLQVVGVDVLENARKAEDFRRTHHLTYPAVVDDGTLRDQYDINGLPVHVFIDRAGIVRNVVVGELSAQDMRANVQRLLR